VGALVTLAGTLAAEHVTKLFLATGVTSHTYWHTYFTRSQIATCQASFQLKIAQNGLVFFGERKRVIRYGKRPTR
jgi:hypothetical protein